MPSIPQSDPNILERNLKALEIRSPKAATLIRDSAPSTEVEFSFAPNGEIIAVMDGRALCSKRRPTDEATTWAEQYDPHRVGFLGIMGFGIGHHLSALYQLHGNHSVLLCFEPNIELLRAVFERVDHSEWITKSVFLLATNPTDAPGITQLMFQTEAFLSTGVELATHPPNKKRLGQSANEFSTTFLNVVKITRTHLVTVLAQSGFAMRNILMNAGTYATSPGINTLKDSCKGRTAILIAAGPSLERNLHLLEDPTIRDRVVIIAVQTMLKPLLKRGIKPHFVTALDHHEISKRFYEGLTKEDVDGVRLVVEPKANAAIIETFPGEILCPSEPQLDRILGDDLARDMGTLPAGATVAHLNYYLARYMGCKNIILIGQDLGFTDGQYYASGASIHNVWAGELSEHRTLEMFEWERIARMKNLLNLKQDIHNRPIFTDQQMATYIAQFEDDFQQDTQRDDPIRIINATEGGVNISNTEIMTLRNALDECLDDQQIKIPETAHLAPADESRKHKIKARMELVIRQLDSIECNSQKTIKLIQKTQDNIDDAAKADRCITQIHAIRNDVMSSEPGFGLVNFVNQKGGLDRFKVDRGISLLKDLTPHQRQSKQLDRDANNVRWIEDSTLQVKKLMERSLGVFNGTASPLTRDEFADEQPTLEIKQDSNHRVEAVIFADPEFNALGSPRNLAQPIYRNLNALELTIKRLQTCTRIDGITIISPLPDRIKSMMSIAGPLPVRIVGADPETLRTRTKSIGQARFASSECWRGSIGSLSCYDEALEPITLARIMDEHNIEAAAIVGSDWAMVDPTLVDRIVARHRADPDRCRIPFSQAVPGIGCCVIDRSAVESLATATSNSSVFGSIGAMFSYIPIGPQADPIASPLCVGVDLFIRDAGVRVVADSTVRIQAMAAAYAGLGEFAMAADAKVLVKAFAHELQTREQSRPARIELELTTDRQAQGLWGAMNEAPKSAQMTTEQAQQLLKDAHLLRDDCSVNFTGRGDPLSHPDLLDIINAASQLGIPNIELRTDLIKTNINPETLVSAGLGVLSINVLANTPSIYKAMTNFDGFDQLLDAMQALFNARPKHHLPTPWIVPRITRCDAAYQDIQGFYDRWLTVCGCAVIDQNPNHDSSDRIQPLRIPDNRASQLEARTLRIQADGQVINHLGQPIQNTNALELGIEQSYKNFRQSLEQPTDTHIEPKAANTLAATS